MCIVTTCFSTWFICQLVVTTSITGTCVYHASTCGENVSRSDSLFFPCRCSIDVIYGALWSCPECPAIMIGNGSALDWHTRADAHERAFAPTPTTSHPKPLTPRVWLGSGRNPPLAQLCYRLHTCMCQVHSHAASPSAMGSQPRTVTQHGLQPTSMTQTQKRIMQMHNPGS